MISAQAMTGFATSVIDGLTESEINRAMRIGIDAVCKLGGCPRIAIVARARLIEPDFSII